MQFSTASIFAAAVTLAAMINAAPAGTNVETPPKPDLVTVGRVWVDANMQGASQDITVGALPSPCMNFGGAFQDSISSINVNSGVVCTFWIDVDCKGASLTVFGSVSNLAGTQFQDNISSVQCST